jgi:hypothetical protein
VNINDKPVCDSKVVYGGEGLWDHDGKNGTRTIQGISTCDTPIKVSKGDKMKIVVHYNLEAHPS